MPKCRRTIKIKKNVKHPVRVRCSQCFDCRKIRRSSLVLSMILEHAFSEHSQFITLTFDPKYYDNPEFDYFDKSHFQQFIKRLRNNHKTIKGEKPIRYLIAGEHGDAFKRWHYHLIFFHLPTPLDKEEWKKLWRLGIVHVGTVTPASMNYTAGYVTKMNFFQTDHKHHDPLDRTYSSWSQQIGKEGILFIARDFAKQGIVLPEYMYSLTFKGQQYLPTSRLRDIFHDEYTKLTGIVPYKDNDYAQYIKQEVAFVLTTQEEIDNAEISYQNRTYKHHMERKHEITYPAPTPESEIFASNPYLSTEDKTKIHSRETLQTLLTQDGEYIRENSHKHQYTPKKRK